MQYITGQVTLTNVDHPEQPPVVLRIPGGKIDLSSNFKEGAPQFCCAHAFGRLTGGRRQAQNEDRSRGPGFRHCRAVCFVIHLFRLGVFILSSIIYQPRSAASLPLDLEEIGAETLS